MATTYQFGVFELDLDTLELKRSGRLCALQPQPARALALLVVKAGELVTREELVRVLWPEDTFVDAEGGLNVAIRQIRRVLRDDARAPKFVETLPKRGYRFVAPIKTDTDDESAKPLTTQTDVGNALPTPMTWPHGFLTERSKRSSRPLVTVGVFAVVTVLLLTFVWIEDVAGIRPLQGLADDSESSRPRLTLAVLALENLGETTDSDYLATAIGEMLLSELELSDELRMIPSARVTAMHRDLDRPWSRVDDALLDAVRKYTGADLVVHGSYLALGDDEHTQVRVDLRLQDTVHGRVVATAAGHGERAELFDLVSTLGARLREQLGIDSATTKALESLRTGMPATADGTRLYSLGLAAMHRLEIPAACEILDDAAALEPNAAKVLDTVARCWSRAGYDARSSQTAARALAAAASLPRQERLRIEGFLFESRYAWQRAREVYQAVWTDFPNDLDHALDLARVQAYTGTPGDALVLLDSLVDTELDTARLHLAIAEAARAAGDFERQLDAAQRATSMAEQIGARMLKAQASLVQAEALHQVGDSDTARALAELASRELESFGDRRLLADALVRRLDASNMNGIGISLSHEEALGIFRVAGDRLGVGRALVRIARESRHYDLDLAEEQIEEALALAD
ncbi:MAG: winged helix-turn-helix domain-containing protein, partial [Acidobacteriota bacterium]